VRRHFGMDASDRSVRIAANCGNFHSFAAPHVTIRERAQARVLHVRSPDPGIQRAGVARARARQPGFSYTSARRMSLSASGRRLPFGRSATGRRPSRARAWWKPPQALGGRGIASCPCRMRTVTALSPSERTVGEVPRAQVRARTRWVDQRRKFASFRTVHCTVTLRPGPYRRSDPRWTPYRRTKSRPSLPYRRTKAFGAVQAIGTEATSRVYASVSPRPRLLARWEAERGDASRARAGARPSVA
jgi:hypothetical protein